MSELFKNKYRIPSTRLQSWNYADNAMYFITICTANRECFFGNVVEAKGVVGTPRNFGASLRHDTPQPIAEPEFKMELNDLGKVVETEWLKTIELRPDMNLELDDYVVMPNHFHGIIFIGENKYNMKEFKDEPDCRAAMHRVSTMGDPNGYANDNQKNKFGPQAKNLASVVRGFKSSVTNYARKNNISFDWQARFHDHIIASNKEYLRIANYIVNNPQNWREDKFYRK